MTAPEGLDRDRQQDVQHVTFLAIVVPVMPHRLSLKCPKAGNNGSIRAQSEVEHDRALHIAALRSACRTQTRRRPADALAENPEVIGTSGQIRALEGCTKQFGRPYPAAAGWLCHTQRAVSSVGSAQPVGCMLKPFAGPSSAACPMVSPLKSGCQHCVTAPKW